MSEPKHTWRFPNSGGGDGGRASTVARKLRRARWTKANRKRRFNGEKIYFPREAYPAGPEGQAAWQRNQLTGGGK